MIHHIIHTVKQAVADLLAEFDPTPPIGREEALDKIRRYRWEVTQQYHRGKSLPNVRRERQALRKLYKIIREG